MKQDWEIRKFEDCLEKVGYTNKIQRNDFLEVGEYPIISQEQDFINGYWNNSEDLFKVKKPLVIFGDHTQVLKYVDFDFVLGADGVKILQTINLIDPRFFYYFLQNINLGSLGYARHYRLLKEIEVSYPPIPEQHYIVTILDEAFVSIDKAKSNIEKNIQNAKELILSKRNDLFESLSKELESKPIEDFCEAIFAGGDAPKENFSPTKTEEFPIPIIANAVKDNGLYGFTNKARVHKPSITVAARGSGTGHTEYRDYPFLPIVRLIVLTPDISKIEVEFLMYAIKSLVIERSGSAIPQLTVPMIKSYSIPVPNLVAQIQIVESLSKLDEYISGYILKLEKKLLELDELKKSILQKAFAGELTNKFLVN
ncbi:MAG: restriction endonuclease subunit S [Crocinitomicaceae bacterium]|nr:restriction endonuclease subunit S [Crocinitomicaceae bacterium]MCF8432931.1 restriction endonuclease subunit S [Crocinitomicaceae bacterium]